MSEPKGIIYPPPELRGIVDSTAKYVAKNGGAFEERIMREHKGKPKFSFLFPGDPFNAYYKHKVKSENEAQQLQLQRQQQQQQTSHPNQERSDPDRRISRDPDERSEQPERGETNRELGRQQVEPSTNSKEANEHEGSRVKFTETRERAGDTSEREGREPGVRPKLNEYMQEISMRLEEPPNLNFLANPASSITHLESDVMKLTSQYIAAYGRPFLLELVSREQGNSRFDFLKPQHGQFPYMTHLIMQYALITNAPLDIMEQLEKDSASQKHVLDRIKMRAEWNRMLELERRKRDEAKEQEKLLYSQIDWHDFVIVETIDYQPDEVGAYPPTTPDQVGTRLLMQQRTEDHIVPEEMEIDMDME